MDGQTMGSQVERWEVRMFSHRDPTHKYPSLLFRKRQLSVLLISLETEGQKLLGSLSFSSRKNFYINRGLPLCIFSFYLLRVTDSWTGTSGSSPTPRPLVGTAYRLWPRRYKEPCVLYWQKSSPSLLPTEVDFGVVCFTHVSLSHPTFTWHSLTFQIEDKVVYPRKRFVIGWLDYAE